MPHLISLLLLVLMFFKVSAIHVYTHQDTSVDQVENCKICDLALENQDNEQVSVTTLSVETDEYYPIVLQPALYEVESLVSSLAHLRLFSRPPPTHCS